MRHYEHFKLDFLSSLKKLETREQYVKPFILARKYEITPLDVRDKLVHWTQEGIISLEVCVDTMFRPYTDSPTTNDFFDHAKQHAQGDVRVKLLTRGA